MWLLLIQSSIHRILLWWCMVSLLASWLSTETMLYWALNIYSYKRNCVGLKPRQNGQHFAHIIIPPASTKLKVGYTGFTWSVRPSVCPSVCGQNSVCSVSSTILVGSTSYLHILLLSNFRRCVTCLIFGKFLEFATLTLSFYDMGSDVNH